MIVWLLPLLILTLLVGAIIGFCIGKWVAYQEAIKVLLNSTSDSLDSLRDYLRSIWK